MEIFTCEDISTAADNNLLNESLITLWLYPRAFSIQNRGYVYLKALCFGKPNFETVFCEDTSSVVLHISDGQIPYFRNWMCGRLCYSSRSNNLTWHWWRAT